MMSLFRSFNFPLSIQPHHRVAMISILWLVGFGSLVVGGSLLAVYGGFLGSLPSEEELTHIRQDLASEIYASDNTLIGKYFVKNREFTPFEDISPWVIQALIATEDARFYEHNGIDNRSLARVAVKSVILQDRSSGGGSTISQQLAKNLFARKYHHFLALPFVKGREMIIAKRLERVYSKEELLTLYLNTVAFGENIYGVETAARRYFNKEQYELEVQDAAILVGMLKATTTYNPRLHPEAAIGRRNVVFHQMAKYGQLTEQEADSLKECPLELQYSPLTQHDGPAPYFRDYLRKHLDSLLTGVKRPDGNSYQIDRDGLKIYTTIDARMQMYAEDAMRSHMSHLQSQFDQHYQQNIPADVWEKTLATLPAYQHLKEQGLSRKDIETKLQQPKSMTLFTWQGPKDTLLSVWDSARYALCLLQSGMLVADPITGAIKAWVGGINHRFFQYDHVSSKRQVGSTFKPIVYAAALQKGFTPCDFISNRKKIYQTENDWSPRNSDGKYNGRYSLQGGLVKSVNTVTTKLMDEVGVRHVNRLARQMGIHSPIPNDLTASLGSGSASLMEMVQVYSTLTHGGRHLPLTCVERIEDREGNVIWEAPSKVKGIPILTSQQSKLITHMLKQVVNQGTATRLRYRYGLWQDIAGKTGTSQDHKDGWFVGAVPGLVAGAWVGADNPGIHFRSMRLGQGANTALPMWAEFFKRLSQDPAYSHYQRKRFPDLGEELSSEFNCPLFLPGIKPLKLPNIPIKSLISSLEVRFNKNSK